MENEPRITSVKIEHLYAIGKIAVQAPEWKPALEEITNLVHSILIFDNIVVYLTDSRTNTMDVMYARAMGRGRSAEADIAWGENLANQVSSGKTTILREPDVSGDQDRLNRPHMLGIPLVANDVCQGVMILIRFGSPAFTHDHIKLAEFIGNQIALLVERQDLQRKYQLLEAHIRQNQLQEDFISTISHELRSPLGFIKGYTTTLLRSDTVWDQTTQQEFLKIIDHETDLLQELIGNLLDSTRLQSGQLKFNFQLVRLDALLKEIISRSKLHHPDLSLNLKLEGTQIPITADPIRLTQVIENLVINCVKYAPKSAVEIAINQTEDLARISVIDHGPGIQTDYLPLLFTRFFRDPAHDPNIHGTGLGLFICKQIIQAHHGYINVNSIFGQGSCFTISLPTNQDGSTKIEDVK
jgi:K+-sensing histidine kinase KdpD